VPEGGKVIAIDVRFGSEVDMCGAQAQFRFTPESDIVEFPLWAKSGHGLLEVKLRQTLNQSG